jgi:hypothetical protein
MDRVKLRNNDGGVPGESDGGYPEVMLRCRAHANAHCVVRRRLRTPTPGAGVINRVAAAAPRPASKNASR